MPTITWGPFCATLDRPLLRAAIQEGRRRATGFSVSLAPMAPRERAERIPLLPTGDFEWWAQDLLDAAHRESVAAGLKATVSTPSAVGVMAALASRAARTEFRRWMSVTEVIDS
jgi:hypothetical protein